MPRYAFPLSCSGPGGKPSWILWAKLSPWEWQSSRMGRALSSYNWTGKSSHDLIAFHERNAPFGLRLRSFWDLLAAAVKPISKILP